MVETIFSYDEADLGAFEYTRFGGRLVIAALPYSRCIQHFFHLLCCLDLKVTRHCLLLFEDHRICNDFIDHPSE